MSEETAEQVSRTAEALAATQEHLRQRQQVIVEAVADRLPAAIDGIAKRAAQSQPEVTKALGVEGVKQLRTDLRGKAERLAAELRDAVAKIDWPLRTSEYDPVVARKVHSAFFHYFYGRRADSVAAIFKKHGYDIQDDNARSAQGLVHPNSFYEEAMFTEVAEALNELASAEEAHARAKRVDDEDIVAGIWDEA